MKAGNARFAGETVSESQAVSVGEVTGELLCCDGLNFYFICGG